MAEGRNKVDEIQELRRKYRGILPVYDLLALTTTRDGCMMQTPSWHLGILAGLSDGEPCRE